MAWKWYWWTSRSLSSSVVDPIRMDPHWLGSPRSGSVLGMQIRIQEQVTQKFTNKPDFLLFYLRRYYVLLPIRHRTYLYKKHRTIYFSCKNYTFCGGKAWLGSEYGSPWIRMEVKCWIRMRIHNTAFFQLAVAVWYYPPTSKKSKPVSKPNMHSSCLFCNLFFRKWSTL